MHILLTNDDGPPPSFDCPPHLNSSPYISTFVRVLQSPPFNHTVSVVLPSQQRSWIGKAHLLPPSVYPTHQKTSTNEVVSDELSPSYYDPKTGKVFDERPSDGQEYWVLVAGTPASCTQLGLFHYDLLFPSSTLSVKDPNADGPRPSSKIDLVISGPNHGRNTTAAFALSSGTLGGALEASVCGVKAMALSFAFFTRQEPQNLVEEASVHSVKIIEKLFREWTTSTLSDSKSQPDSPDLFTINVPLLEDVAKRPTKWTWVLDNKWPSGSLYTANGESSVDENGKQNKPTFKWSPSFGDIWKTIDASPEGNDGRVVREQCSSISPLKANFLGLWGKAGFEGEFKL